MSLPKISPSSPIVGVGAFALLLGVLMVPTFEKLLNTWAGDLSYSHGYFILPLAVMLGVRRCCRAGPPDLARGEVPRALAAMVIGATFMRLVSCWPGRCSTG